MASHEAANIMHTDTKKGLTRAQVQKRFDRFGKNEITESKKQNIIVRFLNQFRDLMVLVLLASALLSFAVSVINKDSEYIDSIIILIIVVSNAFIGMLQELKADKAIDALKKMSSPRARVIRNGRREDIEAELLVPGDVVILKAGDLVPADIRLTKTIELRIEESALTGESVPTDKDSEAVCPPNAEISERKNMAFASTGVVSGAGIGIVSETGMRTNMGQIAQILDSEKSPETPLQQKLSQTGKILAFGVMGICVVIFAMGLIQKIEPLEMFMISISLAVAAIPEGLTAVITIVLAMGIKRMAQKRAIVRHMPAVETLGSTQIICSDKTGTLTQNKMTITSFIGGNGEEKLDSLIAQFSLELCTLCNNSEEVGGKILGDPTETAFLGACAVPKNQLDEKLPRVGEIPFSSKRKMMTTAHKIGDGFRIISKGAPDVLLARCTHQLKGNSVVELSAAGKARIISANEGLASKALRVLAVAYKDVSIVSQNDNDTESNLIFCGLTSMEDPPRAGTKEAVRICKRAGIIPVMITGDHAATAFAIGKRIGIADDNSGIMTGSELDRLSEGELSRKIFDYRIFARVSPEHKVKIVKAFQNRNMVVAMTGDGVNDAPALKAADIGCAMGKNGTEVAKSAADMVLTDDDFSTIVSAVREGRGIYKNIRKTIHFLLSCNIGEILIVFVGFLMRVPTPLLAIQLLWVNLVTDSLPALALGADPIESEVMKEEPHSKNEGIFSGGMGFSIVAEGLLIGALSLLAYIIGRSFFDIDIQNPIIGRTMAFAVLSLSQLVHSFNMRSKHSVLRLGVFKNKKLTIAAAVCAVLMISVVVFPPLSAVFKTTMLGSLQWLIVIILSAFPLLVVEVEKELVCKIPKYGRKYR